MRTIIFLLFATINFKCSSHRIKNLDEPKTYAPSLVYSIRPLQILSDEDESLGADLRLSIVEKSENDSFLIYKTISSHESKNVGFLMMIPKAKEEKRFGQKMVIKSVGLESDNLLRLLTKLYDQRQDTAMKFVKNVILNYANLNEFEKSVTGHQSQTNDTEIDYKIFFEGNREEDYAEMFLNINVQENWVEIREKDEEYRPIVLRFLKQQ